MGINQELVYNDNIEKLKWEKLYSLSETELWDYLYEQDSKEPTDDEIIIKYKSGTEEFIQEIRAFHDKLTALAATNNISLKNKFDFIMDLNMLKCAYKAYIPRDSYVENYEVNYNRYISSKSGFLGTEEILKNILIEKF